MIFNEINEYIGERNENKNLTLTSVYESMNTLKKYEEIWNQIKYLIKSKSDLDNHGEKCMKIKFNSNPIPLGKIGMKMKNKSKILNINHLHVVVTKIHGLSQYCS